VFDADAKRVAMWRCEGTADRGVSLGTVDTWGWNSDGILTSETSIVREGAACIQTTMSGPSGSAQTDLFVIGGGVSPATVPIGTTSGYLQFSLRSSDELPNLHVYLGDDTSNYLHWFGGAIEEYGTADIDTWKLYNLQLSSANDVYGSPGTAANKYTMLKVVVTSGTPSSAWVTYLDYVNLFEGDGNMLAHGTVDYDKEWGTDVNVYYNLKMVPS
jgi:hypothetical protein